MAKAKKKEPQAKELGVIEEIRKKHGKESVMRLGDGVIQPVEVISTGSLGLDIATGVGGLPRGRIIEIFGPESSGKTTLTLHQIAEAQKLGEVCAFVDAEHALDIGYAKKLGVDTGALLVSQPDHGEQALDIVEMYARSASVGVIIVDSVAALTPRSEIEGDMGDHHVGKHARLMSQAMRKLASVVSRSKAIVYFTNQTRMKIGVMFGSPVTTTGGNALKFYSSVRLKINRIETLKKGDEDARGIRTRVQVVKNKVAPPFREAEFDILYGEGIFSEGEIIEWGTDVGIVDKNGAWFSYDGSKVGQGRANAAMALRSDRKIRNEIESKLRAHFGLPEAEAAL